MVLVALAAATQRVVDRRSGSGRPYAEAHATPTPAPNNRALVPELGSDESTVVRSRTASTADHLPIDQALPGAPESVAPEPSRSASRY
jgi:hypothetical protein